MVTPLIPHPRMNDRHFVLYPLQDIYPDFVHPTDQTHIQKLIKNLDPSYEIYPLEQTQSSIGFAINPCPSKIISAQFNYIFCDLKKRKQNFEKPMGYMISIDFDWEFHQEILTYNDSGI